MISLPDYQIFSEIYESSHSRIYQGVRQSDQQPVILKRLSQDYPSSEALNRFQQEYQITRSFAVEGVIQALDLLPYHHSLVMVLEDFGGESLNRILSRRRFSWLEGLPIARQLTVALQTIHHQQIIHKDINPANIVINLTTGQLKIIDFGLATFSFKEDPSVLALEGTLAYLSPEQTGRMNRPVDYRTDFYALGVTLYHLFTGVLPFDSSDPAEVLHSHLARQPASLCQRDPDIPEILSRLVLKLMAKSAADRYQSCQGILADLDNCLEQAGREGRLTIFVLGRQDGGDRLEIPGKLYGRDPEWQALFSSFEEVRQGGSRLVLITGASGVGKSQLVKELYKPITANRGYFIWGKFEQQQVNSPYSALLDALRQMVRQWLALPPSEIDGWRQRLTQALGSQLSLLLSVIPELTWLVGSQPPATTSEAGEVKNRFQQALATLIQVGAQAERGLVLFLDDGQWADSASLAVIEPLLVANRAQPFMLIVAYRDQEVTSSHPLLLTVQRCQESAIPMQSIHLRPLDQAAVVQLLRDTLHQDPRSLSPLARLIRQKTGGNPFFIEQFLKYLQEEGLLTWQGEAGKWIWDPQAIAAAPVTEHGVELLLQKLKKFPAVTQRALGLAACLGSDFRLEMLANLLRMSFAKAFQALWLALRADIIRPTSPLQIVEETASDPTTNSQDHPPHLLIVSYVFLHDRLQQAAYELIAPQERAEIHYQIGCWFGQQSPAEQERHLFDWVYHLNQGSAYLKTPEVRLSLARLNQQAGARALAAAAFAAALDYFRQGAEVIDPWGWSVDEELALALHLQWAEAAYLNGLTEQVDPLVEKCLEHAHTPLQRAKVLLLKTSVYRTQGRYQEVWQWGELALGELGVVLPPPDQLGEAVISEEVAEIWRQLAGAAPEICLDLPPMRDPQQVMIVNLLIPLCTAAYFLHPPGLIWLYARMVNLSIRYGNHPQSAFAYVGFGDALGSRLHRRAEGYRFGKLGITLAEASQNPALQGKTLQIFAGYIDHWQESVRISRQRAIQAFEYCLSGGVLVAAAFCATFFSYRTLVQGDPLTLAAADTQRCLEFLQKIRYESEYPFPLLCQQMIRAYQGMTQNGSSFDDDQFSEGEYLAFLQERGMKSALHLFWILKCQLLYAFGQYNLGLAAARKAGELEYTSIAHLRVGEHHFYWGLLAIQMWALAPLEDQGSLWQEVVDQRQLLQEWASQCPANYLSKHELLEAEIARFQKNISAALSHYERAIQQAKSTGFLQVEALAQERLAEFWAEQNHQRYATLHWREASYLYQRWQATAKVKHLQQIALDRIGNSQEATSFSPLPTPASHASTLPVIALTSTVDPIDYTTSHLDLKAVVKAAQALAQEIHVGQLLTKLMQILLEHAGADRAYFLLASEDKLSMLAAATVQPDQVEICSPVPLEQAHLPQTLIWYSARTLSPILLNEASLQQPYATDPYLQTHHPKSLLCLPILHQAKLIGILYLENTQISDAFTPERLEILSVLSSQAAISLENARLYEQLQAYSYTLEARVEERTQALQREIEERQYIEAALRRSEQKFAKAFHACPDAMLLSNLETGRLLEANDSFLQMTGYALEEILGKTSLELNFWVDPQDRIRLFQNLREKGSVRNLEINFYAKNADVRTGLVSAEIVDLDGHPCLLTVTNDITEVKRVEQLKNEFVSVVSHELRTPLTSIRGSLGLIIGGVGGSISEQTRSLVDIAYKNSDRLMLLINDILDIEKIESGKMNFEIKRYALLPLLEQAIESNRTYAAQYQVEFVLVSGVDGEVEVDSHRLTQVITNLLSNAAKFSPPESQVIIQTQYTPPYLRVMVTDRGSGIPEEFHSRIFQKFAQADSSSTRSKGGTGLGLSISKAIIERLGGKIGFETQAEVGTTFYFDLPLAEYSPVIPSTSSQFADRGPTK
ncbi:MAG: AAA family ATPase [Cyanobacteriota bacterium]|nr:AAA family ATPase [Cyanobacteriota bacterium]